MVYIILETHGGAEYAIVATDEDGANLVFDTEQEALEASEDFQDPQIIELPY